MGNDRNTDSSGCCLFGLFLLSLFLGFLLACLLLLLLGLFCQLGCLLLLHLQLVLVVFYGFQFIFMDRLHFLVHQIYESIDLLFLVFLLLQLVLADCKDENGHLIYVLDLHEGVFVI